jgi:hypothetical protein
LSNWRPSVRTFRRWRSRRAGGTGCAGGKRDLASY